MLKTILYFYFTKAFQSAIIRELESILVTLMLVTLMLTIFNKILLKGDKNGT
ncbi:hypothetical protein E0F46_07200 [Streptococcus pyogenes]|nr:hypothetical protein E0F46_07200 [Streptococcus pyogenes]